jgi:multidrug efflux pump subunit AcrA (membrane-fusion protein)
MSRSRLQRWIIAIFGLGSIVGATLLAVGSRGEDVADQAPPRALPVSTVRCSAIFSFRTMRRYTGRIAPARDSQLAFERAGKVVAVLVDQGDRVEAGQEMARLDTRHLLTEKRRLEASLSEASARLEELVAGPREEQIAAAEAEVRSLFAQLRLQELNVQRRVTLLKSNAISQEEYDTARFGMEANSAGLDAAQQRLNELRAGTRPEQIAAAKAALEQLEASLAGIGHDLEDCELKAPFAGTVADRFIDEGAVITPQTAVARVVEDASLEAWVGLPAEAARQISTGQAVTVRAANQRVRGVAIAVLPELDLATRTRRVVVRVDEDAALLPGQVVRLEVPEEIATSGFRLPASALVSASRGLWSCYAVVSDDNGALRAERRDVEVLHTSGEEVVVRGTLQDGEAIVAGGTHRVAHGQLVRVVPASQEEAVSANRPEEGPRPAMTTAPYGVSSSEI